MAVTASADNINVGSRIILLRKVSATDGTQYGQMNIKGIVKYAWQEVYKTTLASAQTSMTISNLLGNTDILYRLKVRAVSGIANNNFYVRPNNDTGGNYGNQILTGNNTTVAAARDTSETYFWLTNTADNDANEIADSEMIIYAKSGYIRPAIVTSSEKITGTTVTQSNLYGQAWADTTNQITSMVVTSGDNGLGIGTAITLERLNL
jgi:hypothetical protein